MGRKRTGHVWRKGDHWHARLGGEYLGTFESEERARGAIEAALQRDKQADKNAFSVRGEAYMKREEELARERRGNTRVWQKEVSLWDRHIRASKLYRMSLKAIRREHVQDLLDSIAKTEALQIVPQAGGGLKRVGTGRRIGERTIARVRSRLTHFFDTCLELPSNPAARCKIPNVKAIKQRKDGDRKPHLHADEIARLFDLLEMTDEHRAVYALCVYAGLRVDELWGLRWENVIRLDGEDPELHVRWSYDSPTKTEMSQREIPMLPQLVKELKAYRASLPSPPIAGVVFPGEDGKKTRSPGSNAMWPDKPYTNEAGKRVVRVGYRTLAKVRPHLHFKHLRHTFGTHLLEGTFTHGHEWPIEKVSEMLGHEDIATTVKHYVSRQASRLHKEVKKGLSLAPKKPTRNRP